MIWPSGQRLWEVKLVGFGREGCGVLCQTSVPESPFETSTVRDPQAAPLQDSQQHVQPVHTLSPTPAQVHPLNQTVKPDEPPKRAPRIPKNPYSPYQWVFAVEDRAVRGLNKVTMKLQNP